MLTNEAALRDLLAKHQPELAPRLARRLAQLPPQHVTALLAEGAAADLTPALREVIDVALAEELGEGGLQEVAPKLTESRLASSGSAGSAQGRAASAATTKEGSLLMRVASIQPEMAHDLTRLIEKEGQECVRRCMASEVVLKQQVMKALKQLFAEEEDTQPADHGGHGHVGHVLPGDVRLVERQPLGKQVRSIKSSQSQVPRQINSEAEKTWPPAPAAPAPLKSEVQRGYTGSQGSIAPPSKGRIWGLQDFLSELGLSEYEEEVVKWASDMGAIFLEELVENAQDLSEAMGLKPLERKRLERHGPQAMRQIIAQRPRGAATVASRGASSGARASGAQVTPAAPSPDELPMGLFRR